MARQHPLDTPGLFGEAIPKDETGRGPLLRRWGFPPFTVLNAQAGPWQERKRAWMALGIKSELGRGAGEFKNHKGAIYSGDPRWCAIPGGEVPLAGTARAIHFNSAELLGRPEGTVANNGTSVFDPVICELMYGWFCTPGGRVLDPFAGGSVRGIVAGMMGYRYDGFDLSKRQIEANRVQADDILTQGAREGVRWWEADSQELSLHTGQEDYDFVFSCPPYHDLEVYSDNPADISTMSYKDFMAALTRIIAHAMRALKPNRFACFVVGDLRGPDGFLRNFPAHVVDAFHLTGARLYNSAILMSQLTTLPMRTSHNFPVMRKLGKAHQDILIFCKGDPRAASAGLDKGAIE